MRPVGLVFLVDREESLQMHLWRRAITMIGQDPDEIKLQSFGDALRNLSSIAVKNPRWQMRRSTVAREEVGAKEQLPPLAIESTVTCCMARKVNHGQTLPNIQYMPVIE